MGEAIGAYTPERFPYYEILGELSERIQMEGMTPVRAYEEFLNERDTFELGPYFDYASTSRGTGGHACVPGKAREEIIASNTQTARDIVSVLDAHGSIEGREVLLPVDLGDTGWTASRAMLFCALVIAGPDLRSRGGGLRPLTNFENRLYRRMGECGVRTDIMDSDRDLETCSPHYFGLVRAFAGLIHDMDLPGTPAHRLVSLVDNRASLEGRAECLLADELAIPRQRVVATGPMQDARSALPLERLRQDVNVIANYGGYIMEAQTDARLMLTRDTEPITE